MVFHKPEFCRGIAMVLQGESLKAGAYVNHRGSLGGLREKIVRRLIRDQTPSPFLVETGLVYCGQTQTTSRQCDILIHGSSTHAPLYRWEDFVVVQRTDARAVVEVKSMLDSERFGELLDVHSSLVAMTIATDRAWNATPTFGYALNGVTFPTFVEYLQAAVRTNRLGQEGESRCINWPVCVAVQERHYVGFRPLHRMAESTWPIVFCAIDFNQLQRPEGEIIDGMETGEFIDIYSVVLGQPDHALYAEQIYPWFNELPINEQGKAWVTTDGQAHFGRIIY